MLDAVVFAMATKKCKAEEMEVAEVFTVWSPNYHQSSAAKKCQNKILYWKTNGREVDDADGVISAATKITITSTIGCSDVGGTK